MGFLNWIILNFQCFPYLLDIYLNAMMKPYSLKWDWTKVLNGVPNIPIVITDPFSFSNYSWNRNFLPTILSFLTSYNAELFDFITYHTKLHCFRILSWDSLRAFHQNIKRNLKLDAIFKLFDPRTFWHTSCQIMNFEFWLLIRG